MVLASSERKLSTNSCFCHFGHWPDLGAQRLALDLGVNGVVSWQAARCFFNQSSSSSRGQTWRGSHHPHPAVPWRMAKWSVPARVEPISRDRRYIAISPLTIELFQNLHTFKWSLLATYPATSEAQSWPPRHTFTSSDQFGTRPSAVPQSMRCMILPWLTVVLLRLLAVSVSVGMYIYIVSSIPDINRKERFIFAGLALVPEIGKLAGAHRVVYGRVQSCLNPARIRHLIKF